MLLTTKSAALILGAALASATPVDVTSSTASSCNTRQFLTVSTSNGPITGHQASNSACVIEYLGIPFAQPPVGNLRFAAPAKIRSKKPYVAANFGFDCPLTPSKPVNYPGFTPQAQQIVNYFASAAGTPQSEDCLTLNIWSKATQNALKAKKPVLVFFYGGRYTIGNTDSPFYSGKYFADSEDIVVVTVNYRLNIFGFPGAPGETQNLGLRDQRAAVEWVRDNIKQFGGDPSKITISGQSAGGVAVDYWTYAYKKDPIVNGVIAHSGNVFSFPVNAPGVPEKNWDTVVAAVNCTSASNVMSCMRQADWTAIKAAAAGIKPTPSSSVLRSIPAFYPMPDEQLVFSDYLSLTNAGKFAKVPLLLGNNNNEDGYYRIPAFASGIVPTADQVVSFLLESFTCPVSHQANARRNHGVPAWAYRYMADWDNTRLYPTSGAYHGVDLHMIFGASADVSGLPTTADQRSLTKLMQHAWFTFSNNPTSGLSSLGWPQFNKKKASLIVLGQNNRPKAQFVSPSVFDLTCPNITLAGLGSVVSTVADAVTQPLLDY
ncbi:alpha/beta-hydrolase [Trichoderma afarasin]|uniref:Carboxylic ester hydrolase n=1 Tax=Trichoderma lentiforme TaxID=1567552 RepID=A0A9P4X5L3_9HYPO|nr:Acetylcholinesterase [Trichoderma lentiforme]